MAEPSQIGWTCAHCRQVVERPVVGPGVDFHVGDQAPDYVLMKIRLRCPLCADVTEVKVGNRPY